MLRSLRAVLVASALLPPAGLALLWTLPGARLGRKLLGSAAIAAWGVAYLALLFGLRFELDGSGSRPRAKFFRREAHYAQLERNRAGQAAAPIVPVAARPAPQETSNPARVPAAGVYWTA